MPVSPVGTSIGLPGPPRAVGGLPARGPGRGEFEHLLGKARGAGEGSPRAGADEARDAAEQFVAITLVEPIFKQLRESSMAAPPFAPSQGETQFRAMLDANLARELTRAARFPLVERLARDLRGGAGDVQSVANAVRA